MQTEKERMMRMIGIIGAGIMAKGMALNFMQQGYPVAVWNRTQANAQDIIDAGAVWADTPAEVAAQADVLIECVTDDVASREVWMNSQEGILSTAKPGAVLIASSSLSLEWTDELIGLCEERGLAFLDMPITGSRLGAESGTLRLLVGGNEAVLDSIRTELAAISEKIYYFGPAGSGMRFKLILNSLIGIHTNAAAQAAGLAQAAGIDINAVGFALRDGGMGPSGPTTNAFFANYNMPREQVNFAVQWIEKDLRYARAMAKQYNADFSLLADAQMNFSKAQNAGLGEQDQVRIGDLYLRDHAA